MTECAGCAQLIHDRYVFNVLDKSWHQSCLRCSDCLQPMTDTCFTRDGLILCKTDFTRRYSQHCAGCEGELKKEDLVRRARDKVFHVGCFQCSVCQRRLDTGEQLYILEGNRFVCQTDFDASKASTTTTTTSPSTTARPDYLTSSPCQPSVSVSNGSVCNSECEDENMEGCEEVALEDGDGEKGEDGSAAKRRGPRTTIKAKQLETLKNAFATTPKPTRHIREQLAVETGLNMRVIQVWFQNRRSKERRMKAMRFGYRPARRSRGGGRDEIMPDMFGQEQVNAAFFSQPPLPFFCDPYGPPSGNSVDRPMGFEPPQLVHGDNSFVPDRTSPMNSAMANGMMSEFEQDMSAFHPLPSMYPAELKPMAGW